MNHPHQLSQGDLDLLCLLSCSSHPKPVPLLPTGLPEEGGWTSAWEQCQAPGAATSWEAHTPDPHCRSAFTGAAPALTHQTISIKGPRNACAFSKTDILGCPPFLPPWKEKGPVNAGPGVGHPLTPS